MASDTASGSNDTKLLGRVALLGELHKGILGPLWLGQLASGDDAGSLVATRRIELGGDIDDLTLEALGSAFERGLGLEHDNVVALVEASREGKELVVVSHYQPAEPLRSVLRLAGVGRKPVPPAIAARIALDLLEGCAYLHVNEVLASLTPDNVVLGSDGVTRILEPVLSHAAAAEAAWKVQPKRVTYAAPEQLGDEPGDARSDLFSVGILMWEMLRNRPLFGGSNFEQAAERVRSAAIGRADALKPAGGEQIPKPLADVVERALVRKPDDRFANADEMLEALGACKAATHAEVARYAKELLVDAFAAQERKVAVAKRGADASAKPSPPQKLKALPGKPKLPPRTRHATMQVNPEDLISVAPMSSVAPPDEPSQAREESAGASDHADSDADQSQASEPTNHESASEPEAAEPAAAKDTELDDAAAVKQQARQAKRTLIGMAVPTSKPPTASAPPADEPSGAGAEDAGDEVPVDDDGGANAPVAKKAAGGFDVMSIADDPSDPDGMDAAAAEALERVRKSQALTAPIQARFSPVVKVAEDAADAPSGKGKLVAIGAALLLVAGGAFVALKGGGGEAPVSTSQTSPTAAPTVAAMATASPTPTTAVTAEPTAAPGATAEAAVTPSAAASTSAAASAVAPPTPVPPTTPVGGVPPKAPAPGPLPKAGPAKPKFTPSEL
jgi:serine/threonine-protein kinase